MSASPQELALREQFDTAEQQKEASTLGMWIFLVTEIMFFGGMFAAYTVYRSFYPEVFARASRTLNATLGAVNTAVLICISFTMVLNRRLVAWCLVLTMLFGAAFLGVKAVEWTEKYQHHHIPGPGFHMDNEPMQGQSQLFFSLYFAMTGMHALHMVVGLGLLATLLIQNAMGQFSPVYYSPVDIVGLYWHFVDIIWIFLFPLLYLIDRHA